MYSKAGVSRTTIVGAKLTQSKDTEAKIGIETTVEPN
jgi:hypothetical protein